MGELASSFNMMLEVIGILKNQEAILDERKTARARTTRREDLLGR